MQQMPQMPINTIVSKVRSNPNGITLKKGWDRRKRAVCPMKTEVFEGVMRGWTKWF